MYKGFKLISSPIWKKENKCFNAGYLLASNKFIRTSSTNNTMVSEAKAIKIPMEYGFVAAKEWGPSSGDRLLAVHGWQDNACSFDPLIPLLLPDLHIIAVDLMGHGQSSHYPAGIPYSQIEFAYQLKCIAERLEWNKFSVMGHSMGSGLGIVFASIFPDMVDKVIGIDLMSPLTYPVKMVVNQINASMETQRSYEKKLQKFSPVYTEVEALRRVLEGTAGTLTENSAKVLMKRGTDLFENGKVSFSRDVRVKNIWFDGYNVFEVMKAIISNIRCELLLIKAKESPTIVHKSALNVFLDIYKTQCKRFELVTVDGNHYVHLNNPERVAPHINAFLRQSLT